MSDPSEKPAARRTTVTKKELIHRISDDTGLTKVVVKDVLQRFLDEIITELERGHRLEFREFGVFEVRKRSARRAQNPRTLEKVDVQAKRVVKFKVGRLMRERVAGERPVPEPAGAAGGAEDRARDAAGASGAPAASVSAPTPPPPPSVAESGDAPPSASPF
ncbi:MAG: HU family DNA-binding protein [Planctomycetota bacterium]|jgi:nucleoid DNA-binding protein|nr:HU family DNA-binding protein [Planctomycetota bacterium]MDP6762187.1 HU family DNA-binding protein [Planctomycetota bacterium]MDP6990075.1 HU family DNA-binding protein [Planctomycetota bacterium]